MKSYMGGHIGTHLDSLGHVSKNGKWFTGIMASKEKAYHTRLKKFGIDKTSSIIGGEEYYWISQNVKECKY